MITLYPEKIKRKFGLVRKNYDLYLLLIPGLLYLIIFKYVPMKGIVISFMDFDIFKGILGSPWVGFKQFSTLFSMPDFYRVFFNTLIISVYKIVFTFPIPIIVALLLNEIGSMIFKRVSQTVIYLPHFLSWVIVGGLFINILSPSDGIVNQIITGLGLKPVNFLMDNHFFRGVVVFTEGWKETGWSAIIYIAAIAGIEQDQYNAAVIDGAGKLQQIWYVTIPGIMSTIVLLFILRLGSIMDAGFEQVFVMYNPAVYDSGDIIGTFIYRIGISNMEYSFATAAGLFNSLIGFILLISGNFISKRLLQKSIW